MTILVLALAAGGALLGALGARLNRVGTSDELTLWIGAGAVGTPLAVGEWWVILRLMGVPFALLPAAIGVVAVSGTLAAAATPSLDQSDRRSSWTVSCALKSVRSPIASTAGAAAALLVKIFGKPVDLRRGMLFLQVGPGRGALALGALAWCRSRCFRDRCIPDALARHEAVHSRTVAAVGELGFYLTYLTAGVLWARIQGGPWNGLTPEGCGQPFEKLAHTYTSDPAVAFRCRGTWRRRSSRPLPTNRFGRAVSDVAPADSGTQ